MNHLVIGLGEIGSALRSVIRAEGYDPMKNTKPPEGMVFDVLHICFPFDTVFAQQVKAYRRYLDPAGEQLVVIHSTVPIGTSRKLEAHHSPVRGKHPHIASSLRVFKKYVAGPRAAEICKEFRQYDISAVPCERPEDTEAGKLLDLMQYGVSILLNKEIKKFCDDNGIDFDLAYTHFNETYNKGYSQLNMPQFIRPNLKYMPGKIGGHCVAQNMVHVNTASAQKIIKANEIL